MGSVFDSKRTSLLDFESWYPIGDCEIDNLIISNEKGSMGQNIVHTNFYINATLTRKYESRNPWTKCIMIEV